MMARANLGQLLGNVGANAAPAKPEVSSGEAADETEQAPSKVATKTVRTPSRVVPAVDEQSVKPPIEESARPAYLRYVRKETRLREDQQNDLTLQARRLNRAKQTQGARITENSLIRVAVDLFLVQIDRAAGDDEDAIRESMTQ